MTWYWIPYLFPVLFRIEFPLRVHFWVSFSYLAIFSFIANNTKHSVLTIYQNCSLYNMHIDVFYTWAHLIFTAIIWGGCYHCSSFTDEKICAQTGQSTSQLVSGRKWKKVKWSRSAMSHSLWPHRLQPTRLLCPWDFPGKNTGVGSHFLLQGVFPMQGSNPGLPHWRQTL